jgi:hypothetical protein
MFVIAVVSFDHGVRTAFTRDMTIPGNLCLIQTKWQVIDGISDHVFPIEVCELFSDDEEDLSQFMIGNGFQINFVSDGFEQIVVGNAEGADIGIDANFIGSWVGDKHNSSVEMQKGPPIEWQAPFCSG